jgi:5,5'-dehydrodivanillate O-demethylase
MATTAEQNRLLTQIGPGSRMGALLRRYWHPVAGREEIANRWTLPVRVLGEDLVLFKDRNGKLGLIGERCPHRRASMVNGIPTEEGIRCPYHGWMMNHEGRCIDQPFETGRSALKGKKATVAYPIREFQGLIFAYLGPDPAPELPEFDAMTIPGAIRAIGKAIIPCNWLQCMENSADPVHTEWLHGALVEFTKEHEGRKTAMNRRHEAIAFDETSYGFVKRRKYVGQSEDAEDWTVGHPVIFPNMLCNGNNGGGWQNRAFQIRVPIDDENTLHFWYSVYCPPEGSAVPAHLLEKVPVYEVKYRHADGSWNLDVTDGQDIMAWVSQGTISDRTQETLGASDKGIVLYRRMLLRELERMERGEDPLGVIRDPAMTRVELTVEKGKQIYADGFQLVAARNAVSFSPIFEDLMKVFTDSLPDRGDKLQGIPDIREPAAAN